MSAIGKRDLQIIELVGLPGAGKSTIQSELLYDRRFANIQKVLERASGRWAAGEIFGLESLGSALGNGVIYRVYMARVKASLRAYYKYNAPLIDCIHEWLANPSRVGMVTAMRYLEHIATLHNTISRQVLIDKYAIAKNRTVLIDEHWVNLLAFMLAWGEDREWVDWFTRVVRYAPLPNKVIWLNNVAAVSEQRQNEREKIAPLFDKCDDIYRMSAHLEERFAAVVDVLQEQNVEVLTVNAANDIESVKAAILSSIS